MPCRRSPKTVIAQPVAEAKTERVKGDRCPASPANPDKTSLGSRQARTDPLPRIDRFMGSRALGRLGLPLIRHVRLDRPGERRRAAAAGLSLAQ
jgi:hypothetical protein